MASNNRPAYDPCAAIILGESGLNLDVLAAIMGYHLARIADPTQSFYDNDQYMNAVVVGYTQLAHLMNRGNDAKR